VTTTSPLVQRAIVAATEAMDADVDLFGVPVDLPGRAVAFVTAPIRLVVKIDADLERARKEATAFADLAGAVAVPEVWFSHLSTDDEGRQHWVSGISFCDGDRLAAGDEPSWVDAGRVLRSLHSSGATAWHNHPSHPDDLHDWVTGLSEHSEQSGLLDRTAAKAFRQATPFTNDSSRTPTPIHGDLTADYMFHDGHQVSGIINLGDSGLGDPAYDVATLTLWRPDLLESVLAGYSHIKASEEFTADLEQFQLVRLLIGAQWLHTQGFSPAPYLSELYERLLHRPS
jgi:aminoglycoside phosphotransferase (APT) family kinase protein